MKRSALKKRQKDDISICNPGNTFEKKKKKETGVPVFQMRCRQGKGRTIFVQRNPGEKKRCTVWCLIAIVSGMVCRVHSPERKKGKERFPRCRRERGSDDKSLCDEREMPSASREKEKYLCNHL